MNHALANAASQESAAISADRLCLYADTTNILHDINLAVPRGAVVGLVGRNGAGKSSLLSCLVGLTEPSHGSASLLGCPSMRLTDTVRDRLGFVAQSTDLFEWMEVYEHLKTIGRAYSRWDEKSCLKLAAKLNLPMGGLVRDLSGGDRQKLAVVLALAHKPDVLLLDEPVSNLDPITRRDFMRALFTDRNDAADEDGNNAPTIIISSHLLSDLERVVSHVAFIRQGRLQLFDTWDAMLEHIRLLPADAINVPKEATLHINSISQRHVIDTRLAPAWQHAGQALTLDELFVELNG